MAIKKPGEGEENKPGSGDEEKNYLTEADLDAKLNAALTNYMKRFEKKVNDMLAPVMTKMDEVNGKLETAAKAAEKPAGGEKPGESGMSPEVEAKFKRMEDELAKARKAQEDAEAQRKADAEKAKAEKLSATLSTALRDAGITNAVQAKAAQALIEREERVAWDEEDGELKLKVKDKYGEKLVALGEGLADWVKSEEGTVFLPPRSAAGSGNEGGGRRLPGKTPKDPKEARKAEARATLTEAFGS